MAMLMVGVEPDLVYSTVNSATSVAVLEDMGVEVEAHPEFVMDPNFEMVAADGPDLIVMSEASGFPNKIKKFEKIAPSIVLSFGDGWQNALEQSGEIFDAADAAARAEKAIANRVQSVRQGLPENASVSVIFGYENGLHFPSPKAPMSRLLDEVGLARPDIERNATGKESGAFIFATSPENLDKHEASRMAILSETYYDAGFVRSQPLFDGLGVARGDRAVDVDGETWWGNSVFTVWWILEDVEAMFGDGTVGAVDDAVTRWGSLQDELR